MAKGTIEENAARLMAVRIEQGQVYLGHVLSVGKYQTAVAPEDGLQRFAVIGGHEPEIHTSAKLAAWAFVDVEGAEHAVALMLRSIVDDEEPSGGNPH